MELERLSTAYRVKHIAEADVPEVYALCMGNPQSEAFWAKNQFTKTGVEVQAEGYTIVMMQRQP